MAVILTVLPSFAVLAETLATPEMTNPAGTFSEGVTSEERLSDWLLRKPLTDDLYPLGLQWLVPEERPAQSQQKAQLLSELRRLEGRDPTVHLSEFVDALPVTGRIPLPAAEARWLQANGASDPVIAPGESVKTQRRSTRVALLMSDGSICAMNQRDGAVVQDYITACNYPALDNADVAWVIQSDGTLQVQKIASWNATPLSELSPGAIIWAPSRDAQFSVELSTRLATFLATQTVETVAQASRRERLPQAALRPSFTVQKGLPLTSNDWGLIGVLQTPSARMEPEGEFRFNYSLVGPYRRYNVFV